MRSTELRCRFDRKKLENNLPLMIPDQFPNVPFPLLSTMNQLTWDCNYSESNLISSNLSEHDFTLKLPLLLTYAFNAV